MAAIDFPDSPNVNDTFTSGDQTWIWNGTVWNKVVTPGGPTGPTGPTGAGATGPTGPTGSVSSTISQDLPSGGSSGDIWFVY